ncbi:hydroxyacid dehydrogenase [Synoicihabitans lomoniglobus]|uniref:Hydroxyacid dehydrogenase n=1 Tax=Synoicihabitans lomoniglobus TaxID=2909285 RepID=A0AAF0I3R1_9BACT|nr:hydroxyacid dehydrogenase [Opitutaceae bacterium LMO-M01]WED67212.1 hydroxyacid dehydrogenase [Opitutaceae bacterium LMO-M01]
MPRPASILQCLTPIEIQEFLPGSSADEIRALAPVLTTVDPTNLSHSAWRDLLFQRNPEVLVACWATPDLPPELPPALRYVCYFAGSIKRLVPREHIELGLIVTNWGNSISRIVAEGALLHVLAGMRNFTHWTIAMHTQGAWKSRTSRSASLFGRRVGIRGFGRVAHELIALLRPFGCTISVFAPDLTPAIAEQNGLRVAFDLNELMRENDVVVELAPLIPETRGSITKAHLELLRPGSVFVNVGRGATVDEQALLEVARGGQIFVGLDVFGEEPLPADSGFRNLPNVSLTPHLAGPTTDRRCDAGAFALKNLRAYAEDRPMESVITLPIYDRST